MYLHMNNNWAKSTVCKVTGMVFAAVKIKVIPQIFPTILGVKNTNFYTFHKMYASKITIWNKMVNLSLKMVKNIFGITVILTASKNHTSNFADSLFGPIIVHMQMHPSLHLPISNIIQCIFKIFQIIVDFLKIVFFSFLKFFQIKLINIKMSLPQWNFACNFSL